MTHRRPPRLLIAGMGNVLRGDDGFGVRVAKAAAERSWGRDGLAVEVVEVGIGGLHLVQQLQERYDALVIVDAVERGGTPGDLFVLEPTVPDAREMDPGERRSVVAETHQTVPARVLVMARALDALPNHVLILGCQPAAVDELGMELSPAVAEAVPRALRRLEALVEGFGRDGSFPSSGADASTVRSGRTTP